MFLTTNSLMDFRNGMQKLYCLIVHTGNLCLQILWYLLHLIFSLWCLALGIAGAIESQLISRGILKRYKSLNVDKLKYLAIVIESEDACNIPRVIELLQLLVGIGVNRVCLYDSEGVLKKAKDSILATMSNSRLLEKAEESESLLDHKHITLEFVSSCDGKEAVTKAANLLFRRYLQLSDLGKIEEEKFFTEARMTAALSEVGCRGPEPDLLLVYGPTRCHLGFPAWRIRYTEIIHMGPLKSMRYGSLMKAIYRFTLVRQNYGT